MKRFINVPFIITGIIAAILVFLLFTSPDADEMTFPIGIGVVAIGIILGVTKRKK